MDYELFFQLFTFAPNLRVLEFGDTLDICERLSTKLKECDGYIDLITDSDIDTNQNVNKKIKDYNSDLQITDRAYEYVIVCDIYDKVQNIESILKSAYHSLENSGDIYVVCKKDLMISHKIKEALDSVDYRAINDIDISDDYYIITAKKMHMWGNGL
jgi:hypothetical protein